MKMCRQIENPTPSIDGYLHVLEELPNFIPIRF